MRSEQCTMIGALPPDGLACYERLSWDRNDCRLLHRTCDYACSRSPKGGDFLQVFQDHPIFVSADLL